MFRPVNNSETGEVGDETLFRCHQNCDFVCAENAGGQIVLGTLIAKVLGGDSLDLRYQHVNAKGELMMGLCRSTPELLHDGRPRLYEKWR